MKYLSAEEIVAVNKRVLERLGQKATGLQYPHGLSVVVEQPQMVVFGTELYPTIWLKAAYIMQKITKKHIFEDGNKRTAYISTLLFLHRNGYQLRLTTDEAEALILQLTLSDDTEDEMKEIATVLERNSLAIID